MVAAFNRADHTVNCAGRDLDVRVFAPAASLVSEVLAKAAVDVFGSPPESLQWIGFSFTKPVLGVTSARPPEVRVNGRWLKIFCSAPALPGAA